MAQFDPTKYGATPSSSNVTSGFDPSKYGAIRLTPPDEVVKETVWSNIKDIAKEVPGAVKQIATRSPLQNAQDVVLGAMDLGPTLVNSAAGLVNKITGKDTIKSRLPMLGETFRDYTGTQSDVSTAVQESAKNVAAYELGGAPFKGLTPTTMFGKFSKGAAGNILGGQLVADPNSTLKERGNQALFDAAFGLVTEGVGPLAKKVFGKKELPVKVPKEKLTAEQYSQSEGYEPYINPSELPIIPYGKGVKPEPTIKYGKNRPDVYTGDIINSIDNASTNSLSKSNVGIKNGTVKYLKDNPGEIANREVRLREVDGKITIEDGRHTLAAAKETGITPKFVDVTAEYTGKPSSKIDDLINGNKSFEETVKIASPKFKEKVVKQAKVLEDNTSPFNDSPLDRTPGRKIKQSAAFERYMENGKESWVRAVADGVEDPNLSPQSAHRLLEEYYIKTNQPEKIKDLVRSIDDTVSKSGQSLSDLNQGLGSESPSLNLRKVELLKEANLVKQGVSMDSVKAEIKTQVEQALKDLSEGKSSQDIINKLLDDFSC